MTLEEREVVVEVTSTPQLEAVEVRVVHIVLVEGAPEPKKGETTPPRNVLNLRL